MKWYVPVIWYRGILLIHDLSQYDCLVFDGKEHVRIANLPGMWDRTVTVGSAGSMKSILPQCPDVY